MAESNLIRDLVEAARQFDSRELWKRFTNYDCFAVHLPGHEEPILASVMGAAGEEYGLMLFRGPHAFHSFAALAAPDGPGDDTTEAMDMLSFRMELFGEIDPQIQALYRQASVHPKFYEEVPDFLVKPANCRPRLPNEEDLALLLHVARAATIADRRKLLTPTELDDAEGICVLQVKDDSPVPEVSVTRERPCRSCPPTAHLFAGSAVDLSGLPRCGGTWLVGTPPVPAGIKGDDRSMQMVLAVDEASGIVVQTKPFFAGEMGEAVEAMIEAFRYPPPGGSGGLPDEIVFSNRRLCDAMATALETEGVACSYCAWIPELQDIIADLLHTLEAHLSSAGDPTEDDGVPALDDLAGWKEVDRRLCLRIGDFFRDDDRLWSSRAAKRYFGDDELDFYLEEYDRLGVIGAYSTWGVVDYRPTRKSKTEAEKMLARGLPEAEKMLLQARMESHPSIYRVACVNPREATVDLEDVLLGGTVTVRDQLLSENIDKNVFLVVRPFQAGQFNFIDTSGPPLGQGMVGEAIEFLQDLGMEFTPEAMARDAHLFGRLWDWMDEWQADRPLPILRNMDGDDMVFHTASFSINDAAATRKAISRRRDIDFDEYNDEFAWIRAQGKAAETLGGPVLLGRIEFVNDELVLTTNSERRFEEAREWLTKLPGVAFNQVEIRPTEEMLSDPRPDETISPPELMEIPPDIAAGLQNRLTQQYMDWIDTPLPVLGDKTPRETCRTAAGRREVATLIRTIPDPMGNAPVTVPRTAMLEELGLESLGTSSSSSGRYQSQIENANGFMPPVAPVVNDAPKTGRNDPCPCGSGRKFKKCCGRYQ